MMAPALAALALLCAYLVCVVVWLVALGCVVLLGCLAIEVTRRSGRWILTRVLTAEIVRKVSLGPSVGAAVRWGAETRRAVALVAWCSRYELRLLVGRQRGEPMAETRAPRSPTSRIQR